MDECTVKDENMTTSLITVSTAHLKEPTVSIGRVGNRMMPKSS